MKRKYTLLIAAAFIVIIATTSCGKRKESCAAYDRVQVQQSK